VVVAVVVEVAAGAPSSFRITPALCLRDLGVADALEHDGQGLVTSGTVSPKILTWMRAGPGLADRKRAPSGP
jgi:hypothetical protein